MLEYEIRILNADRRIGTVLEGIYVSDHSAIRAAQRTAGSRPFEVWRGLDCIYGRTGPRSPSDAPRSGAGPSNTGLG